MTRQELRVYVLAHREDDDGIEALMKRRNLNSPKYPLIKLCKGIVQICDRINRGEPAYLVDDSQPFPQPLYEAFQVLSLKWILRDEQMRHPAILCIIVAQYSCYSCDRPYN